MQVRAIGERGDDRNVLTVGWLSESPLPEVI